MASTSYNIHIPKLCKVSSLNFDDKYFKAFQCHTYVGTVTFNHNFWRKHPPARKSILENEEISLFCTSFNDSVYFSLRIKRDFFQKPQNKVNQAKTGALEAVGKAKLAKRLFQ